jgi:hypothetical protein
MSRENYKLTRFFEFNNVSPDEVVESFRIKDELNPTIWASGDIIDPEVKDMLLEIGKTFYDSTDIKAKVKDIILCGSLANYNWHEKYSDFDLHVIIDISEVSDDEELAEQVSDLAKKYWNLTHDIQVRDFDVEVAIQDEDDLSDAIGEGRMGGVYSLTSDKWIKKPEKINFIPDESMIKSKSKSIMLHIDRIEEEKGEHSYDENNDRIKKVWNKIKKYRKDGLE